MPNIWRKQKAFLCDAEIINDSLISPEILADETEQKRNEMKSRLSNLFNRNKDKK